MTSNAYVPPLFVGYVETTVDALLLIYAARQDIIPRITRRLDDSERRTMIKSGAVFIFWVQESQIERWTDGRSWSSSRIFGNFLVYREIERTTSRGHKKPYPHDDSPTRSLTGESSPDQASLGFRTRDGSDQGTIKTGGLIKKTITVNVQESGPEPARLHLISYYTWDDIRSGKLKRPSTRADFMNLYMPPHFFPLTTFRVPPKVEIGPDGRSRLVEVEDSGYSIPVLSPPPSPADATGETRSRTHAGLQGTISALKRNQQKVGLTSIPGLQSLVGVFSAVLNVVVVVHNHYADEEALDMLAQKAGLFVLTLVGDVEKESDLHYINSVIERLGLTEEMNWILGVLNKFQISFISQKDIARIEAKLIKALEILQEPNQHTSTAQRTF